MKGKVIIKNKLAKFAVLFMPIIFCFILTGCSGNTSNGEFKVDKKNKQVIVGEDIYKYDIDDDYSITITYPDGVTYFEMSQGGAQGYSSNIDEKYVEGDVLADEIIKVEIRGKQIISSVCLCVIGILCIILPYLVWRSFNAKKIKGATPSKTLLFIIRIVGLVVGIIVIGTGIVLLFM